MGENTDGSYYRNKPVLVIPNPVPSLSKGLVRNLALRHAETVISPKPREKRKSRGELAEVLTTLADLEIQVEQHTFQVLRKTNAVAWAYNLTWYDAVYVAMAEILGFPCVTADNALHRKMKGHSIVIPLKDLAFG